MSKDLKPKKVKGRIDVLRKQTYRDHSLYIRYIKPDIFEYLVIHENEIYTGYLIITPEKGKNKLTPDQITQSAALIFTGAVATIDMLVDGDPDEKEVKKVKKTTKKKNAKRKPRKKS